MAVRMRGTYPTEPFEQAMLAYFAEHGHPRPVVQVPPTPIVERSATPLLDLPAKSGKRSAHDSPGKETGSKAKKGKPRGNSLMQEKKGKGKAKVVVDEPESEEAEIVEVPATPHSQAGLKLALPGGRVITQPRDLVRRTPRKRGSWTDCALSAITVGPSRHGRRATSSESRRRVSLGARSASTSSRSVHGRAGRVRAEPWARLNSLLTGRRAHL